MLDENGFEDDGTATTTEVTYDDDTTASTLLTEQLCNSKSDNEDEDFATKTLAEPLTNYLLYNRQGISHCKMDVTAGHDKQSGQLGNKLLGRLASAF